MCFPYSKKTLFQAKLQTAVSTYHKKGNEMHVIAQKEDFFFNVFICLEKHVFLKLREKNEIIGGAERNNYLYSYRIDRMKKKMN